MLTDMKNLTKKYLLIEFSTTKPLPADFTDQIAGRIYIMDAVDKSECSARFVDSDFVDFLDHADEVPAILRKQAA